ncbi:T3SS effector HopA1 family protein [Nocardia sp. KC 131]|uniref:T3SS effector HopA1 family protein n=1 Tax=Nocardia arseniciresistens TaxID=3392119 RepID=UPI00398E5CAC
MSSPLGRELLTVLAQISVDLSAGTALVAVRKVREDDPRQLRRLLAVAIYEEFHAGVTGPLPRTRDAAFERILTQSIPHKDYRLPVRVCPSRDGTAAGQETVLVEHDELRIRVPANRIRETAYAPGDLVTLQTSALRPALTSGYMTVHGSHGSPADAVHVPVYVHLANSHSAADAWARVLEFLEVSRACYRAKILDHPAAYPRRNGLIISLHREDETSLRALTGLLRNVAGIAGPTSPFARRIGDGIAVGVVPEDPRPAIGRLTFGQHRATALAAAVIAAARTEHDPHTRIATELRSAGIDPSAPSYNSAMH